MLAVAGIVVGRGVALEHADAGREHPLRILDDLRSAPDRHADELVVRLALLGHDRDARIASEVQHLLCLDLRRERDLTFEEAVPHRDHVDAAIAVQRRDRQRVPLGDERVDLLGRHRNLVALVRAAAVRTRGRLRARFRFGARHQGYQRASDSITQQGFSWPSTSMVISVFVWMPPPATSLTSTSSAPARMRAPTSTGAGKRTLSTP